MATPARRRARRAHGTISALLLAESVSFADDLPAAARIDGRELGIAVTRSG